MDFWVKNKVNFSICVFCKGSCQDVGVEVRMDRLYVIWREPDENARRHIVGELSRARGTFEFKYLAESHQAAEEHGFTGVPGLPYVGSPYEAIHLFPVFQARIPSPRRPDFKMLMQMWGVEGPGVDDQFEILAKSGGVLATDRLEIAEYREVPDDFDRPLEFRIAGYDRCKSGVAELKVGDELCLERERDNEADVRATRLVSGKREKLGYVPKQYAAVFAEALDRGVEISAVTMRRVWLQDDVGAWVVRARKK